MDISWEVVVCRGVVVLCCWQGRDAWSLGWRGDVQMRKKRKVSRVMGWLLSFQLSEPGAGACCAVSMVLLLLLRAVMLGAMS